jgi:hypothetical protein
MADNISQLMTDSGFEPVVPKGPSVPSTFNPGDHAPGEQPKSAKEVAEKSMMGWLNQDTQYFSNNAQIKPYTYDAGMNSSSFYERYKAYGNETFDRIGFSPFKNNDAEFNAGTGAMSEFARTWTHSFKPLFARGFVSGPKSLYRMAHGDFSDDPEEAAAYARAAAIGQSTKGGVLGFTNNMLMNFGYSAGIMSEAILEEVAGIGLSAVLGPEIGMLTTANAGRRVLQGLEGLKAVGTVEKTAVKMADYLKDLNNINKTREFFNATKAGVAAEKTLNYGKRIANFANPLSNTTDAIGAIARNEKQLAGWAKFANASYQTAGALYRDVRNVNMALSEARLEGGFARKDTEDDLIRDYKKTHKGMMPDEKVLDSIKKEAAKASADAILANSLLIYASNKVSFDNIMNPKKGLNGILTKKIADIKTNMAGRTVKEFTKKTLSTGKEILTPKVSWIEKGWKGWKGTVQAIKKQGFQKAALRTIGYTKANLMEGFQESMQDIIAQTAKDYHKQAFYSQPVASYYYTQGQLNDLKDKRSFGKMLGEAALKQVSWQGLETFASGFAMGALAHPLNQALPFAQEKYNQIFNKDKYLAHKKYLNEYSTNMVNSVNKTFENDPLKYYQTKLYGLGIQSELSSVMEDANEKELRDAKNESTIKEITNLIESGTSDIWMDHLEALKGLTTEEYAEAQGITVEEAQGHVEKLDKMIERTKEIEKTYKEINDKLPNPVDLERYEKGTKDYEKAAVYYKAWEEGKKAVIFYGETYKNTVMRMQSVFQDMASNELIGKIDPNRVQVLFKEQRLDSELNILQNEIDTLKGLDDDYSKKQIAEKTDTLKTLKEFKDSYTDFMDHFFRGNQKQDTNEDEFIDSEIRSLENQLAKASSKDKKTIQTKLDNLYQRAETSKADTEKVARRAAARDKKGKINEIDSKIEELNNRKKQIETPEYYETYMKDTQFARKEAQTIDSQIAQLEKDKAAAQEELDGDISFTNDKVLSRLEGSFKKYMNVLAKQSDDIILDGKIDEAFQKLVDYYRLGEESFKMADAVNMLTDPSGFIDHVERTYDWMYSEWNNRENSIKQLINDQIERLKFNQLLNEMAAKGIYVDLDEFADFKEYGVIPSEFYDNINKRVLKSGSPIYEQVSNEFRKLSVVLELVDSMKSDNEKLNDEIKRLNQEEDSEIRKLPTTPQRVKVREFDSSNPFTVKVINDQLGINQYAEVSYTDEGVEKSQIFYKGDDNVLRYDDKTGDEVDTDLKVKFTSGEIFSMIDKANPADVQEIKEKYDQLRSEAAERAVEETSKPFTENAEPVVVEEITADTPVESMPDELRQQLIDAYDAYRRDPKNKSLFPDSLSEDDLSERFKNYIKSEPEALSIIEAYVKEQKLKASTTPAGEVVVPTIMLPNGKTVSADEVSDAVLQETLKRYRLQISELTNRADKLTQSEKDDLTLYKIKANMLSAYIENERVKEMTPELKEAKAKIDLLLKEQDKITPMLTGYDVEGQILRRVSNVIAGLKGEKYAYSKIDEVKALYNETIGVGESVDTFIERLRAANLPGFSEYTYTELKADIEEAIANQKNAPTTQPSSNTEPQKADIETRNKETEAKIKNKTLFLAEYDENGNKTEESVGEKISQSNVAPVATSVREINGIEFVEFSNPETGDVDVVVTGKNDGSYVGYYRLYDKSTVNGEVVYTPTNKWSSKFQNTGSKADFKTMIGGVQDMLPADHEYTEKTSISTDGLRVWNQQLNNGYELQYDKNGNLVTNEVAINGDAIVNQLGIPEERLARGKFRNINVISQAEFDKVKEALLPYLEKFGLNESNIRWMSGPLKNSGTVKIDLPVLKRSTNQSSSNIEAQKADVSTQTTYSELVGEASLEQSGNPLSQGLTYIFFANLTAAVKSGRIKSKAELNAIIAEWDEMAAYNGNPNRMTDSQASILAGEAQRLPDTIQTTTPNQNTTDTLAEIVERSVTEKTYEENRIGGNYVDAQAKTFFDGGKPTYDANKITKEAFDNLFGDNGLFQIIKQWMDTNDMIVVSKGLVVYDKAANVAGEIDLLLANKKGEFFIVDLKTGSKDKWAGYNNPDSVNYAKKMENTYQQGAYVNLLRNMLGITATPKIFPIEVELEKGTGRILKASKPTSSSALKPGKILIDLSVTPEMQAQLDNLIPATEPSVSLVSPSAKVESLVQDGVNETVEGSDYEGPNATATPVTEPTTDRVSQLEKEINNANFDKLQMIELNFGLKDSLEMTADEILQVQEMIDSRRAILSSGETVVTEQKSYSIGDEVYAETAIFTDTGKNKGKVFLEPYEVGVISKIDFAKGTITINPVGKKNQKTIPMDMLDKMFKLKSEVSEEPTVSSSPTADDKAKVKESTDVVSNLLEATNVARQIELEKEASELGSVEETLNELLEDLDC